MKTNFLRSGTITIIMKCSQRASNTSLTVFTLTHTDRAQHHKWDNMHIQAGTNQLNKQKTSLASAKDQSRMCGIIATANTRQDPDGLAPCTLMLPLTPMTWLANPFTILDFCSKVLKFREQPWACQGVWEQPQPSCYWRPGAPLTP